MTPRPSFSKRIEEFGRETPSPFLFTIVVEALSLLLVKVRELGMIGGFEMSRNGEGITHLQFAYDTILFSSTKREEILALRRSVLCF